MNDVMREDPKPVAANKKTGACCRFSASTRVAYATKKLIHGCMPKLVSAVVFGLVVSTASAQNILDEWASVQVPPAPPVKPVTVDTKTTALLMLDFMNQNCGARPRCVASLPAVKKLLDEARAKGVMVVYATGPGGKVADTRSEVTPTGSEPVVSSGPDKFLNTDLEKILKEKGIQTVITIGTAAHGAVLSTASAAGLRGLKVIVPVDGVSAESAYAEQYTAWHLAYGPVFSRNVTLTKLDMVKF